MRTLVTGGVRSGKSAYAEGLLGQRDATYIATGPVSDDADWSARLTAHRERRPCSWRTVETPDAAAAVRALTGPALLDCLGTWLTAQVDRRGAWDDPDPLVRPLIAELAGAVADCPHDLVVVSNEVGWGLVSEHRSGRVFADLLGRTNQSVAAVSDRVVLVVAGCALVVKQP